MITKRDRHLAFGSLCAAAALVGLGVQSTQPADSLPGSLPGVGLVAATADTGPATDVVTITNEERAEAGCPALVVDPQLTAAAQRHSEDMSENDYFSHTSQDGRSFVDRARAEGYTRPSGENIARGQRSAADVMNAWMNSTGHRNNILNCSSRAIGVGFAEDGNVWTQVFGFVAPPAPTTTTPAPTTDPTTTTPAPVTTTTIEPAPVTTTTTEPAPVTTTTTEPAPVTTTTTEPPPVTTTTSEPAPTGPTAEVVAITNEERADAGCAPLEVDPRLTRAAQLHSEDMAENNYFSHTSQDGRSFVDRARAQGVPSPGAENIARGQRSAEQVMDGWMNSEGHRRNILNCSLKTIGVGLAPGNVWTQVFGR